MGRREPTALSLRAGVCPTLLVVGVDGVAVVADGVAAEAEAVDGGADGSGAAVAEDELADAGMDAAEFSGVDAIDDTAAGENVGGTAAEGVFDAGDAAGEGGPGTAEDGSIADLETAEHFGGDVLFAGEEGAAGAVFDAAEAGVAGPADEDELLRRVGGDRGQRGCR